MKDIAYAIIKPDNSITYTHMKIDKDTTNITDEFKEMTIGHTLFCTISNSSLLVIAYGSWGDLNKTATDLMGFALYGTCILCKLSLQYALSDMHELTNDSFDSLEISDLVEALYQIDHADRE